MLQILQLLREPGQGAEPGPVPAAGVCVVHLRGNSATGGDMYCILSCNNTVLSTFLGRYPAARRGQRAAGGGLLVAVCHYHHHHLLR